MRGAYDSHELEPQLIQTVDSLKRHLCADAVRRGRVVPDSCRECESGCAYGKRLFELLGLQQPSWEQPKLKEFMRQEKAAPTLRKRLQWRRK